VFFKAEDPQQLGEWYQRWLAVPVERPYGASFQAGDMPAGGVTVWAPFESSTSYFDPAKKEFMFNLVVDDLDGALSQVKEGGAVIVGVVEELDYGRFGWFIDPEGNKVELWEPKPGPE
jgi:predicted enzyme related to lactoylglutathione lyase